MNTILTADRVQEIFRDCLFKKGEPTEGFIPAEGIQTTVGFHPIRLETHKSEILVMLKELPDAFMQSGGGGMSFLNACQDKDDNQWTGLHQTMEQLFQLGIAVGKAEWQLPREMWAALPGGMPYVVVLDK